MEREVVEQVYAGFWVRFWATLIDSVLLLLIITPILMRIYDNDYLLSAGVIHGVWDLILNYLAPFIVVILFWIYKSATPGKMALKLTIINAKTGGKPSTGQFFVRYLGYILSTLPFLLGFLWVAFDKKKRGWHDLLSGTIVIRNKLPEPVKLSR